MERDLNKKLDKYIKKYEQADDIKKTNIYQLKINYYRNKLQKYKQKGGNEEDVVQQPESEKPESEKPEPVAQVGGDSEKEYEIIRNTELSNLLDKYDENMTIGEDIFNF